VIDTGVLVVRLRCESDAVGAVGGCASADGVSLVSGGHVPVPAVRVNQRTVLVNPGSSAVPVGGVGLYARFPHMISVRIWIGRCRLREWAAQGNAPVVRVEAEVGSAMNGARRKVRRLLADPQVTVVVWSIGIGWGA